MARKRIRGSSTKHKRTVLRKVSSTSMPSKTGSIMRNPPSTNLGTTKKVTSSRRTVKGMKLPGRQPKNYSTPTN